ncbi:MAG TPA: Spy/CpxP family protein refolding chaperone [Steroidobacteraceae bacterium]|nr:Spy/CpxP family protein refolding chaperone [Steroidobacteraceae bacterium]
MKSNRNLLMAGLLAAGAALGATGWSIANAADDAMAGPPPAGAHQWHHHGGEWHLLGKLDLSAAQKQQIKEIMTAAHPQMQSLHSQMQANSLKLRQTAPTDPNYSTIAAQVSQTHGSLSAQMMAQHADVRAQVFKVLTPAQQTQLATLEAQMQAHKHGSHGPDAGAMPPAAQ